MKRFALAVTIVLVFAKHAVADDCNFCNERVPTADSTEIPVGCPLDVYVISIDTSKFPPNLARVLPDGSHVPVAATIETSHELLVVDFDTIDDQCDDHFSSEAFDYTIFSATGFIASPGDVLVLGTAAPVVIGGPAPCARGAPRFVCMTSVQSWCTCPPNRNDDHCDAGGGSGLATIGIVLAIVVRRRRRTCNRL